MVISGRDLSARSWFESESGAVRVHVCGVLVAAGARNLLRDCDTSLWCGDFQVEMQLVSVSSR